jgi:hypothetical protein
VVDTVVARMRALLVGGQGIPVEEFLSRPATQWVLPE